MLASQHVLNLAKSDRIAATDALRAVPLDSQVALVCEAPLSRRAEILGLLPAPESVIPLIPEAELCFIVKAVGIADSTWILECASPEQIVTCVDLDIWRGTSPNQPALAEWMDALSDTGDESFLRAVRAIDPEVVLMYLQQRISCFQKPDDDDGWQPPEGGQTVDGQFYFVAMRSNDDLAPVIVMLRSLFAADYWVYFRLMQGIIHELEIPNEEWALRWRTGRLEDLGFPPWERAMEIYRFIRPADRTAILDVPMTVGEWHLPVWMPSLPAAPDHKHLLFRALAQLDEDERRAALYAFMALVNKIAVADRMELGDCDSTPRAIEKAACFASAGLEFIAGERGIEALQVVRHTTLERLFSVGANLDPERAKPS